MLIMWVFLPIKACPICCSGCSASQDIRVTRFAQPSINPLVCCICWTGLLGRAVFPPWDEGPNFGSYISSEHPGLISFRMDWLDLLAVQGTLKSLLQHHSSKASLFPRSAFFTVQLSHPYMITGKTIVLTRQTFAGKLMFLLFNMLPRLVITFLLRSKRLLISWLQSPSAVILVGGGLLVLCSSPGPPVVK